MAALATWAALVPASFAGVELTRMNNIRKREGQAPFFSAGLVLPALAVAIVAFPAWGLDDDGATALGLQLTSVSFALVNASIAVGHPRSDLLRGIQVQVTAGSRVSIGWAVAI